MPPLCKGGKWNPISREIQLGVAPAVVCVGFFSPKLTVPPDLPHLSDGGTLLSCCLEGGATASRTLLLLGSLSRTVEGVDGDP